MLVSTSETFLGKFVCLLLFAESSCFAWASLIPSRCILVVPVRGAQLIIVARCVPSLYEYTTFPVALLCVAILVCFYTFPNWPALIPLAFVATTIRPQSHAKSFGLSFVPFPIIDLSVWKLGFTFYEL